MCPPSGQGGALGSLWFGRHAPTLRYLRSDIKSVRFSVSDKWTPSGLPTLSSARTACPPLPRRSSSPSPCRLLPVMQGEWHTSDTFLLPAGRGAGAQGLCLAFLLRFEHGARGRAVWPLTSGQLPLHFPSMSHALAACRAHQLHPASQGSLPSWLKSRHPGQTPACHATPGAPRSPPLEPARAF